MFRLPRRALLLTPALAAALALGPGGRAFARMAADPGSARLLDVVALASCLAPLGVAVLAARFHQWRLTFASLLLGIVGAGASFDALPLDGPGAPALIVAIALTLALVSHLDERGVRSRAGVRRFALAGTLALLPSILAWRCPDDLLDLMNRLGPAPQPTPGTGLPWVGVLLVLAACAACWRSPGRDADVVSASLTAALVAGMSAIVLADGTTLAMPAVAAPFALLGACGTLLLGTLVIAWRRGYVDDLTQIPGRRALDAELDAIAGEYAIAVVDVDHFKRFNDEHGHDAGDDVLRIVARVLSSVRGGAAYRQGGEEFVILFPDATLAEAEDALQELREAIESTPLVVRGVRGKRRHALRITASMGVAARSPRNPGARQTLRAADQALLKAKRNGRNRVEAERRRLPSSERRSA